MARRYLGYGTTNSQGIATLDHDPEGNIITGYTGVGAGLVDIIATSGTLQSEIYELLDALFYDKGVTSDYNSNWENTSNRLTVSRDSTGTILDCQSENNGYYISNRNITAPFAIEFNMIAISGQSYISFDSTTSKVRLDSRLQGGEKVRLEFENNVTKLYINDEYNSQFPTETLKYIAFLVFPSAQVKYSEFKVYPI